jgi:hypothetical protein
MNGNNFTFNQSAHLEGRNSKEHDVTTRMSERGPPGGNPLKRVRKTRSQTQRRALL